MTGMKVAMVAAAIFFGIGAVIPCLRKEGAGPPNWTDAGLCLWTVAWLLGH